MSDIFQYYNVTCDLILIFFLCDKHLNWCLNNVKCDFDSDANAEIRNQLWTDQTMMVLLLIDSHGIAIN